MKTLLITLLFATAAPQQTAQPAQPANPQFEIVPIRNNVYMLAGDGGNVALSVGPDGVGREAELVRCRAEYRAGPRPHPLVGTWRDKVGVPDERRPTLAARAHQAAEVPVHPSDGHP